MALKIKQKDTKLPPDFDFTFQKAVEELAKLGVLFEAKDEKYEIDICLGFVYSVNHRGQLWVASENADYSLDCRVKLAANKAWAEWRKAIFGKMRCGILI